jgi:hypothetical protein
MVRPTLSDVYRDVQEIARGAVSRSAPYPTAVDVDADFFGVAGVTSVPDAEAGVALSPISTPVREKVRMKRVKRMGRVRQRLGRIGLSSQVGLGR